jgi:hypothetical protein
MKVAILLIIILSIIRESKSTAQCAYGGQHYECGAKLPNGQYCNFVSCGYSSNCCQVVLCSNYVNCECRLGTNDLTLCKNNLDLATFKFNGTELKDYLSQIEK